MLIVETFRTLRRWIAFERRLFEIAGASPSTDGISLHAAWRAAQLEPLVPALHDVEAVAVEVDPSLDVPALLALLADAYEAAATDLTEVSDAPLARALLRISPDIRADLDALS